MRLALKLMKLRLSPEHKIVKLIKLRLSWPEYKIIKLIKLHLS